MNRNTLRFIFITFWTSFVITLSLCFVIQTYQPKQHIVYKVLPTPQDVVKIQHPYYCVGHVDCRTLAQAIYYESRGEPIEGQIAVAWVILNRALSPHFPDSIHSVVYQDNQFSYVDDVKHEYFANFEAYQTALLVAKNVLLGHIPDPTNGATFYLNPRAIKHLPKWTHKFTQVAVIGSHVFYKR